MVRAPPALGSQPAPGPHTHSAVSAYAVSGSRDGLALEGLALQPWPVLLFADPSSWGRARDRLPERSSSVGQPCHQPHEFRTVQRSHRKQAQSQAAGTGPTTVIVSDATPSRPDLAAGTGSTSVHRPGPRAASKTRPQNATPRASTGGRLNTPSTPTAHRDGGHRSICLGATPGRAVTGPEGIPTSCPPSRSRDNRPQGHGLH